MRRTTGKGLWLGILAVLLCLAGCSGKEKPEPGQTVAVEEEKPEYDLEDTLVEFPGQAISFPQFTGMEREKQEHLNRLLQKEALKRIKKADLGDDVSLTLAYTVKYQTPDFISLLFEPSAAGENPSSFSAFAINLNLMDEIVLSRSSFCWDKKKLLPQLSESGNWIQGGEDVLSGIQTELTEGSFWKKSWKKTEVYFTEDGVGLVIPGSASEKDAGAGVQEAVCELGDGQAAANLYFPRKISGGMVEGQWKYQGEFQFDSLIQKDIYLDWDLFTQMEDGAGEIFWSELLAPEEENPLELLDLGMFYVMGDRIYRDRGYESDGTVSNYVSLLGEDTINELADWGEISGEGQILFQLQDQKDRTPEEAGKHCSIQVQGDEVWTFLYDNTDPQGKYELYVWKRLFGLIAYRCGYGTEEDCIRIWKEGLLSQESVLDQDIFVKAEDVQASETADHIKETHNPWFPYEGGEEVAFNSCYYIENYADVRLRVRKLGSNGQGTLYQLLYNQKNNYRAGKAEEITLEELSPKEQYKSIKGESLGYFWVTPDKIYQMDYLFQRQGETLLAQGALPDTALLVCQEEAIPDKKKGEGLHTSLETHKGEIRWYHFWYENGNQEGRNIRQYIWKKNVGLIGWKSMDTSASAGAEILWQEDYLTVEDNFWFDLYR